MERVLSLLSQVLISLMLIVARASFAEPVNLGHVKSEIQSYHDSGLYEKELAAKIKKAQHYLVQRALENKEQAAPKKLALVLDIDETSVSNYSNIVKRDFVGNRKQIQKEMAAADAPVIKPTLELYKTAKKLNIKVFFITGRIETLRHDTQINLRRAGYLHWAGLYMKPVKYDEDSIIPFKSRARASIAYQGYTIIATVGDQLSDIKGGHAEKGYKLPNPFYYLP